MSPEMRRAKLDQLVESEGFDSLDDLIAATISDSVSPAICMNEGCDYTAEMEPDQRERLVRGLRHEHRRERARARGVHLMTAADHLQGS